MSSAFEALTGKLRRLLGYHPSKRAEKHRRPARSISCRPALEQLEDRTLLSTFSVVNTADSGAGSLRQAILDANAGAGADSIVFDIPVTDANHVYYRNDGVAGTVSVANITATTATDDTTIADIDPDWTHSWWRIKPTSFVGQINGAVVIDGYTQAGASANTNGPLLGSNAILRIELNGSLGGLTGALGHSNGLAVGGIGIKGLVINDWQLEGIYISEQVGGHVIAGNYVGVDVSGSLDRGNGRTGVYITSKNSVIGGTTPSDRNIISGNNLNAGIALNAQSWTGNNSVQGNFIGLARDGVTAFPNIGSGVVVGDINTTVGGTTAGARNVISANTFAGITVGGFGLDVLIQGNYIGTDVTGTLDRGNSTDGVFFTTFHSLSRGTIGGTSAGAGNLISGNQANGISLGNTSQFVTVQGNFIGTDRTGTQAIGNSHRGISVGGSSNQDLIGGTTPEAGNLISGNVLGGIFVDAANYGANQILGNRIGTDVTGTLPLGNGFDGILLENLTKDNTIGGTTAGAGNVIAFNARNGVAVRTQAFGQSIRGNSIHGNGALGIDLSGGNTIPNGVTPNDPGDADTNSTIANTGQNYPVLTSAILNAAITLVSGTLNSTPNTAFVLDFYSSPVADSTGFGEGKTYLGSTNVTTDGAGNASFTASFAVATPVGHVITATATDQSLYDHDSNAGTPLVSRNNTSEFSGARIVIAGNQPPAADAGGPYTVIAGESIMLSAAGTVDVDEPNTGLTYLWDFDGDGNYGETGTARGDEVGMNPVFSAVGLGTGPVTVGLRVTDSTGMTGADTAVVNVFDCTPVPAGIVSWWQAEANATDTADGNHGTRQNGASFAAGKVGQAFSFDGSNDYVQIGPASSLKATNALTVEAWIYPTGAGSGGAFGGIIVNREGEYEIARFADGSIGWAIANPSNQFTGPDSGWYKTTFVAPLNQWTHVALVYDGGMVRVYGNGNLVHTANNGLGAMGDAVPSMNDFRIGGRQQVSQHFAGRIDEPSVYNRALTASEIQAIHGANIAGKCDHADPVANPDAYSVDEGSTLTQTDGRGATTPGNPADDGVLANDTDADGDTLTAMLVDDVSHGDLTLNPDGSFSYTPGVGFVGTDSFTYKANDGSHVTVTETVVFSNNFESSTTGFTPGGTLTSLGLVSLPTDSNGLGSPNQSQWLGRLGTGIVKTPSTEERVTLTLTGLTPGEHYRAAFDLLVGASWDGFAGAPWGQDLWRFEVDGVRLVDTSFANGAQGINFGAYSPQRYTDYDYASPNGADVARFTGADESFSLNQGGNYGNDYAIYRFGRGAFNPILEFTATSTSANLLFARYGTTTDTALDEYWALDDVQVSHVVTTIGGATGEGDSNITTVTITVNSTNDAPIADNDIYQVDEGGTLNPAAPGVLDGDTDADNDSLSAILVSGPANASSFTLNADGSFSYMHDGSETTSDSFTYKANDGQADSNVVTVSITVTPVNDAPVADNDGPYAVAEGGTLSVAAPGVLDGDTDADSPTLTAVLVSGPANASSFTLNADGSFSYMHDGSETTSDSFTYKANDGQADSNVVTVSITVTPVNDAPVADNDGPYAVAEGGVLSVAAPGVLDGDTDADSPTLTAVLVSGPANASSFTLNADGSFSYMHDGSETTSDSFTYQANDGQDDSNVVTVSITVTPVNDAPVADNDGPYAVAEGGTLSVAAPGVLDGDTDADSPTLTAVLVSGPANASSFTLNADGSFSYMHDGSETTSDSFTYQANDGQADSNVVTVSITVTPVNDAPVADDDGPYAVAEGGVLSVAAPGVLDGDTDVDSPTLTAVLVSGPANASSFTLNADGSFSYMHDGSETTSDSFTYQANDGQADSNVVTVSITVTPVNDAPVADNDGPYAVAEGGVLSVAAPGVLDGDTDADSPTLTAVLVSGPANASSFTLHADGSFSYMHDGSETTSDSFTYQANDGQADSNVVTVSITVTPVNDVPVADNDGPYAVAEGGILSVAAPGVLDGDTDADSPTLTAVLVSGPANASNFTLNADGSFSYMHDGSETTSDSFTYKANDGQADSNVVTVSITVTPVNDAPVADNDGPYAVTEGGTLSVATPGVLDGDTDADSPTLTAVLVSGPANASSFTLNADGSFSYMHDGSETTSDSFTYQASDGTDNSNVVTVSITVTPVNDAPVADNDGPYAVTEGGTLSVATPGVLDGDTDADSPTLTAVLVSGPANASNFTLHADGSFSYMHDGSETTSDSFTYKANDGQADSNVVTVSITVTPVNDAPVADNDGASMTEDTPSVSGNVLSNDTDVDAGTSLSVANPGTFNGTYGTLTLSANGSYSYALNSVGVQHLAQGASVTESFSYQASDGFVASNSATLSMTVTGVNDGPVINSNGGGDLAAISIPENTIAVTTMTAVDPDTGATRTFSISGGADAARFSIDAASGALRFLAAPDFEAPADAGADNVYEVRVQVSDGALADTQTIFVTVTDVTENQPPVYIGNGCCDPMALVVQGTEGADKIRIIPQGCGGNGSVKVLLNGREYVFAAGSFTSIVVHGKGGDDDIELSGSIDKHACLFGGAGNDRLKGGAGNDILLGGAGCDLLLGDQGRDLLIGGIGADHLIGNAGDDILVAGTTDFDANDAALCAIMAEWTRCDANYIHRIRHLEHGGGRNGAFVLNDCTVHDDGAVDRLTGSSGCDWFFANRDCGVRDVVTDAHSNEAFEDID